MSVLAELFADKLRAAQHIRPLVVAAELHITAVFLIKHIEIVALHYHIVELEEGKSALHSLLVALKGEHFVYREASSHFSENINIIEV